MNFIYENIASFPRQLSYGNLRSTNLQSIGKAGQYDGVIIVGIGGSALAGEMIKTIGSKIGLRVPIIVWRDYGLPAHPFKHPLFIFASFSGDTEEPISGFLTLIKRKPTPKIAVLATGGKLARLAKQYSLPSVSFDPGILTPRQSTGRMFYSLSLILHTARLAKKVPSFSHLKAHAFETEGKKIARKLYNRLAIIYTDEPLRFLGYIWKIKLNETSKHPAFLNILPEADHNELTAWDRSPRGLRIKTAAIFFHSKQAGPRLTKKFNITQKLMTQRGITVIPLSLSGNNILEQSWRMSIFADWTSYYLAKQNGVPESEMQLLNPRIVGNLKQSMK